MQITILEDPQGHYIGYTHPHAGPQRLSFEYWRKKENAEAALANGFWYDRAPFVTGFAWGD